MPFFLYVRLLLLMLSLLSVSVCYNICVVFVTAILLVVDE
jgi:hypothetical protein